MSPKPHIRLDNLRPPYVYYYCPFLRLNVVCNPLFYVDLSSPCVLLLSPEFVGRIQRHPGMRWS
ncbi:hypothetical protein TNCV_3095591, partial [Trichonephila clavipes]